jgi:chromosome segregation ATPase
VWGCARGPEGLPGASNEKLKDLEGKCTKLTNDYRAVANARDKARERLDAVEKEREQLQKQLQVLESVSQERDQLQKQVQARISERDALQQRCDRLKKGLQNLLGQDDAMLTPPAGPVIDHPGRS